MAILLHMEVEKVLSRFPRLTKIKTVGANLVVAGPLSESATVAESDAAAREMLLFTHALVHGSVENYPLCRRCGVNTGPVMAVVIGTTRLAFDLFGDTVNTASRCMSTATTGTLQFSESTASSAGNVSGISARATEVAMKGKGVVSVFVS